MPELPEVEAIRTMLSNRINNKKISNVDVFSDTCIARPSIEVFQNVICGLLINSVNRIGKYLILDLEDDNKLVVHLRMTGNFIYREHCDSLDLPKHIRVAFELTDAMGQKQKLYFCDQRKFGRLWLYENGEDYSRCGIYKLGIEPFDSDYSLEYLKTRLGRTHRTIKTVLLDQSIVSGIGNIYSDEILFTAKIRPDTPSAVLSDEQILAIYNAIPEILSRAIGANRKAIEEYMKGASMQYSDLDKMFVYQKSGKPCKVCGQKIQKLIISGRSSCFCPNCQR